MTVQIVHTSSVGKNVLATLGSERQARQLLARALATRANKLLDSPNDFEHVRSVVLRLRSGIQLDNFQWLSLDGTERLEIVESSSLTTDSRRAAMRRFKILTQIESVITSDESDIEVDEPPMVIGDDLFSIASGPDDA